FWPRSNREPLSGTLSRRPSETLALGLGLALFAADRVQNKSAQHGPGARSGEPPGKLRIGPIHRGIFMKFRSFTALVCAFALAGIGSAAIVGGTTPVYAQEKKKADPKKKDEAPKQNTQQPPQQNV